MKIFYLLTLLIVTQFTFSQNYKQIQIDEQGSLSSILTEEEKQTITHLKIIGNLDARDFKCIRDEVKKIKTLDIKFTEIKPYVGTEGPSTKHEGYTANSIPQYAFIKKYNNNSSSSSGISEIVFPISITSIGKEAFKGCYNLSGYLEIPNSVDTIYQNAFNWCRELDSIKFNSNIKYIGDSAFMSCSGLVGNIVLPSSVKYIGTRAFAGITGTGINSILAENPPAFGDEVFYKKILQVPSGKKLNYSSNPSYSDYKIIDKNGSLSINITNPGTLKSEILSAGYSLDEIVELKLSGNINDSDFRLFYDETTSLISLDLSELSNTYIPNPSFQYNNVITNIILPKNLETIKGGAFMRCKGLSGSIEFPESLKSIGTNAFLDCNRLKSINFPTNLTYIAEGAFSGCYNLECELEKPTKLTQIGDEAFKSSGISGDLIFPDDRSVSIGESAFQNSGLNGTVKIGNMDGSIGKNTFKGTNITSVWLPEGINEIKEYAFADCYKLDTIICEAYNPPYCWGPVFGNYPSIIAYVKDNYTYSYKNAEIWKQLSIRGLDYYYPKKSNVNIEGKGKVLFNDNFLQDNDTILVKYGSHFVLKLIPDSGYFTHEVSFGSDKGSIKDDSTVTIYNWIKKDFEKDLNIIFSPNVGQEVTTAISGKGYISYSSEIIRDGETFLCKTDSSREISLFVERGNYVSQVLFNDSDITNLLNNNKLTLPEFDSSSNLIIKITPISYKIDFKFHGKGKIIYNSNEYKTDFSFSIDSGNTIDMKILADSGYTVEKITVNNLDVTLDISENNIQIDSITKDSEIKIEFIVNKYKVLLNNMGSGLIFEDIVSFGDNRSYNLLPTENNKVEKVFVNGTLYNDSIQNGLLAIKNIVKNYEVIIEPLITRPVDTLIIPVNDTSFYTITDTISFIDTTFISINDTNYVTVYDTISVEDTLIINLSITDAENIIATNKLKLYPNPAKDRLIIDYEDYSKCIGYSVSITSILGKKMFQTLINHPSDNIEISSWEKGVYIVQILNTENQLVSTKKIVKK